MAVSDYDPIIQEAAHEWNVDPLWLKSLMQQETGGNATKNGKPIRSSAGAGGLMQIMPGTAQDLGVQDVDDARQNIFGGAKYASQMLDRYGNVVHATAAYNAGPGRVDAYLAGKGGLPDETKAYVPLVALHYAGFQKVAAGPAAPIQRSAPSIPSDDDFLKATGATSGARVGSVIPSDDDFLKATGAVIKPPAAQSASVTPNDESGIGRDEYGNPLGTLGSPAQSDSGSIPAAMARGVADAFGARPLGIGPETTQALTNAGILGQSGPLGTFNEAAVRMPLALGDLGLRAGGAGIRGLQEGVMALGRATGYEGLARDVAALPEAFPTMGAFGQRPPGLPPAPNPLASFRPADVPMISADFRANPGVLSPQMRLSEGVPVSTNALNTRVVPSDPLSTVARSGGTINPLSSAIIPAAPGVASSVGAAASRDMTPPGQFELTPRETLANRAQAEQEKLNEPQPGGADTNRYVPGVNPTMADMEQSVRTAREQKSLSMISPEIADQARALETANTEARQQYFKDVVGSKTELDRLEQERSAQASKDAATAFKPGQVADAGPVADTIQSILDRPRAKENTQLQKYVTPLFDRLYDEAGDLKSDPEQLYGLREDINRMRSRASQAQDKNLTHVSHELGAISDALDDAISAPGAAPEYSTYMKNYADASKRIDELSVLQGHENGLGGLKTFTPVQRMMKTIVEQRQAPGNNPYKSISDDTMQKLFALRDDLRRVATARDLASARGSDTIQNALDIAKNAAKVGLRGAAHYGLYHATGDLGANALLGMADMAATRKMQLRNVNRAREMLNPNPLQYPPPSE